MAGLRGSGLVRRTVDNNEIDEQNSMSSGIGRIRDVNQGTDGYLYLITSNTDGKAFPDKNDEINLVQPGKNYGWPEQECSGSEKYVDPLVRYDPAMEPGGIVFYSGDKLDLENSLIMAGLRGSGLFSLTFDNNEIDEQKSIISGIGRIRDVKQGPDG